MKKVTKFLIAGALAFSAVSAGSIAISLKAKAVVKTKADNVAHVDTLKINGKRYSDHDFDEDLFHYYDEGWKYEHGTLYLYDYNGSSINFTMCDGIPSTLTVIIIGHNTITTEDDYVSGFSVKGASYQNLDFRFSEDAYLEINSKKNGITVASDNDYGTEIEFSNSLSEEPFESYLRVNAGYNGIVCSNISINNNVNVYVNAEHYALVIHEKINMQQDCFFTLGDNAFLMAIGGYAVCNRSYQNSQYAFWCNRQYMHTPNVGSCLLYGSDETIFNKVLVFKDENPYGGFGAASNEMKYKYQVGENVSFTFNNEPLDESIISAIELDFHYYNLRIEKEYDLKANAAAESLISGFVDTEAAATVTHTFEDERLYVLNDSLVLYNGNMEIGRVTHKFKITPYSYHTVTIDPSVNGFLPLKNYSDYNPDAVKTGSLFRFRLELDSYYLFDHENSSVFANGVEIHNASGVSSSNLIYEIDSVTEDTVITFSRNPYPYAYVTFYVGGTSLSPADELVKKGENITMPKLSDIASYIPSGYTFDYWKVGERSTHYPCSTDTNPVNVQITDEERGILRIEAHFAGLYNLTIEDGHFYSDSACQNEITQAAPVAVGSGHYTYFKFNQNMNEIVDGKMIYNYNKECEREVNIWENSDGVFFFEMVASDLHVSPVYKYVVDEVTAEHVVIPVSGEPLLERTISAPTDANYTVNKFSNQCHKINSDDTETAVYTYDDNHPYTFENNTTYKFSFQFMVPSGWDYILHPDGYLRDGECQIHIDGLDDSDYEIVSADFTNSYKEYYEVVIKMTSVNKYALSVTNGTALLNGEAIAKAFAGQEIVLSADVAPAGMVFDHWTVEGLATTIDEELLHNSRLTIVMPQSDVSAEAHYIEAPYFQISFNANGGTGTMPDGKTYDGFYNLPECIFTAPEHMHFKAWGVGEAEYDELALITVSANTEIKALWAYDEFVVSFNANGGTGTMADVTKEYGSTYTLPASTFTAPAGKEFAGWKVNGEGEVLAAGENITIEGNVELVAEWKDAPVKPAKKKGCGGSVVATSITLSVLALAGVGLLVFKKKEDK